VEQEHETRRRIEELRRRLHQQVDGALARRELSDLLPISQEIDRLAVDFIRRRWQRARAGESEGRFSRISPKRC